MRLFSALAALPLTLSLLALPSTSRVTSAQLRLDGARVLVGLSVTCPEGADLHVEVTVTGVNGDRIAQGTRGQDGLCTGSPQDLTLRVNADPAGALFIRGPATARTVRTICDTSGCAVIPFDETIKITH